MSRHQHVLVKDPRRFGYECVIEGCDHFKHVDEFDDVILLHATE